MCALFMILFILFGFPPWLHGIRAKLNIHSSPSYHLLSLLTLATWFPHKCSLDSDELVVSHAVDFIYFKTAPCCCTAQFCPNTQPPTHVVLFRQSLKKLRPSHCPTYHVRVFWIMGSTLLPPLPTLYTASLSPPQSPLINIFHIVNHLCQLLAIIDN